MRQTLSPRPPTITQVLRIDATIGRAMALTSTFSRRHGMATPPADGSVKPAAVCCWPAHPGALRRLSQRSEAQVIVGQTEAGALPKGTPWNQIAAPLRVPRPEPQSGQSWALQTFHSRQLHMRSCHWARCCAGLRGARFELDCHRDTHRTFSRSPPLPGRRSFAGCCDGGRTKGRSTPRRQVNPGRCGTATFRKSLGGTAAA